MQYRCSICSRTYRWETGRYVCDCGGLFQIEYTKEVLDFDLLGHVREPSLWRYAQALPPFSTETILQVSMQEGGTPLIQLDTHLWGKTDYFMPTLSFKDRGAVVLVAAMRELRVKRCVIDSSGNAGTALAAYCARADIECEVFVPSTTSSQKIAQIEAYQALVHCIEGGREATAQACLTRVQQTGTFYASHVYNPLFWEGTKTYLYEIFEQCNQQLPKLLVVPVGNGTLLMGIAIALQELKRWNYITEFPLLIAVQALNCAPLATAFSNGLQEVPSIATMPSLAEGIAIAHPKRGAEILEAVSALGGMFVTVTEEQILVAQKALAKRGVFVEYTSAANYAGYRNALALKRELEDLDAIIPLCGAGLKSLH